MTRCNLLPAFIKRKLEVSKGLNLQKQNYNH